MRIRSIKPEFWRSDDIAALDWATRLLFIGLWSYVDDNGVGRDVEQLIAADLFALERDPRDTLATVSRGLSKLSDAGLIDRYTVGGRPFLFITGWTKHQRVDKPQKARYDPPTSTDAVPRDTLATPSRDSREGVAPGTGEQGNRGTGEQVSCASVGTDLSPAREARDDEQPRGPAVPLDGRRLVMSVLPRGHTTATITALSIESAALLKQGQPEDVIADAIRLWLDRPRAGEKLLPRLVGDVLRNRGAGNPHSRKAGDTKFDAWLHILDDPTTPPTAIEGPA